MKHNTLKITQGALMTAVFGVLVFLNRQTGGMANGLFLIAYPLPLAVFAAKYGTAAGLPVLAAMTLISLLAGTPATIFYAVAQALTGLVFGTCIYRRATGGKLFFAVVLTTVLADLVNLLFLSSLTGISLQADAAESLRLFKEMLEQPQMQELMQQAGNNAEQLTKMMEEVFSTGMMLRITALSYLLASILQGVLVCEAGLILMKRLKLCAAEPVSFYAFRPPVWTAWAALGCCILYFLGYPMLGGGENLGWMVSVGMAGALYLVIFGGIGVSYLLGKLMPRHRLICGALGVLSMMILVYPDLVLGFFYLTGLGGLFADRGAAARKKQEAAGPFRLDYLVFVNRYHALPAGWEAGIRASLVPVAAEFSEGEILLEKRTAEHAAELLAELRENGIFLKVCRGYRSFAEQETLCEQVRAEYGTGSPEELASLPGYSEHETGLAFDLAAEAPQTPASCPAAGKAPAASGGAADAWRKLEQKCTGYGFVIGAPEGTEPYPGDPRAFRHLRFVGEAAAMKMAWHELSLEEYLKQEQAAAGR